MEPRFTHDCDGCVFLGRLVDAGTDTDVYFCERCDGGSLILRYASEGSQYASMPVALIALFDKRDNSAFVAAAFMLGFMLGGREWNAGCRFDEIEQAVARRTDAHHWPDTVNTGATASVRWLEGWVDEALAVAKTYRIDAAVLNFLGSSFK